MPESWGWECTDAGFKPTTTDIAPAPQKLLKIIRCNCATDCATTWCSCQKHGMKWSIACGQCCGTGCQNATPFLEDDEANNELDD